MEKIRKWGNGGFWTLCLRKEHVSAVPKEKIHVFASQDGKAYFLICFSMYLFDFSFLFIKHEAYSHSTLWQVLWWMCCSAWLYCGHACCEHHKLMINPPFSRSFSAYAVSTPLEFCFPIDMKLCFEVFHHVYCITWIICFLVYVKELVWYLVSSVWIISIICKGHHTV